MSAPENKKFFLQSVIDAFYYFRKALITVVAYLSLRVCGPEVSFRSLWSGTFNSAEHINRNLDAAKDLDALLQEAREVFKRAEVHRAVVIDKCKILLTLSSLLLAAIGVFLPKAFVFSGLWMRVFFCVAVLAFANVVVLLVFFIGVGKETRPAVGQEEVNLSAEDFKKNLINQYLQCETATTNRTHFLVEVYRTAQSFFLFAFTVISVLFVFSCFTYSPENEMKSALQKLRGDQSFIDSIRGEKGDKGERGDRGEKGDRGEQGGRGEKGDRGEASPIIILNTNSPAPKN